MKIKRSQAFVTMITVLYAFSLFPFFTPSANRDFDLCAAIQQMQRLHQTSLSDQVDFQTALSSTIKSLRDIAGISAVIVERSDASATNQTTLLIVAVKSPHLLPTSTPPTVLSSEFQNTSLNEEQLYTSLAFPPEKPPPNLISC